MFGFIIVSCYIFFFFLFKLKMCTAHVTNTLSVWQSQPHYEPKCCTNDLTENKISLELKQFFFSTLTSIFVCPFECASQWNRLSCRRSLSFSRLDFYVWVSEYVLLFSICIKKGDLTSDEVYTCLLFWLSSFIHNIYFEHNCSEHEKFAWWNGNPDFQVYLIGVFFAKNMEKWVKRYLGSRWH